MRFLTTIELTEARSLAKLKSRTDWQKRRIVELYVRFHFSNEFKSHPQDLDDHRFNDLVNLSVGYFKDN